MFARNGLRLSDILLGLLRFLGMKRASVGGVRIMAWLAKLGWLCGAFVV